jgi:hypothetical protein
MPSPKKDEGYKKYLSYLKDFVYIVGIIVALGGWITTKTRSQAILETTVQNNTKTLEKVETFMENQATLNGQFIQYMSMNNN